MFFSRRQNDISAKTADFTHRRGILKGLACLVAAGSFSPFARIAGAASEKRHILTVYFSQTGNTRAVARQIQALGGGDMLELKTERAYPEDHDATVRRAEQERKDDARPRLATPFPATMSDYDIIFVGYPVWVYTMPMALFSFFERFSFSGKTIVPFSTHLGSGLADGPAHIARLCSQATVAEGFAVRGTRVADSRTVVTSRLQQLGIV